MNRRRFIVIFCFIFFLATQISYAAPIFYRIQMKKRMEQQQKQLQGMTPDQYHQYLLYQEQQQGVRLGVEPPTYQQVVDQRNQVIAQAILNAHNQPGVTKTNNSPERSPSPTFFQRIISMLQYLIDLLKRFIEGLFGPIFNKTSVSQPNQAIVQESVNAHNQAINTGNQGTGDISAAVQQVPAAPSGGSSGDQDAVDLSEVWKKLDKKSTVWTLLVDDQAKLLTVSEYIDRFQKEGVKINAPPLHYVQMLDQIAESNPQLLRKPFGELLQMLAIIDYDFDNGMDKDDLAKRALGEAGYEANKKRFTQQQQGQPQGQQQGQQQQ